MSLKTDEFGVLRQRLSHRMEYLESVFLTSKIYIIIVCSRSIPAVQMGSGGNLRNLEPEFTYAYLLQDQVLRRIEYFRFSRLQTSTEQPRDVETK